MPTSAAGPQGRRDKIAKVKTAALKAARSAARVHPVYTTTQRSRTRRFGRSRAVKLTARLRSPPTFPARVTTAEHSMVLVRAASLKDLPGVRYRSSAARWDTQALRRASRRAASTAPRRRRADAAQGTAPKRPLVQRIRVRIAAGHQLVNKVLLDGRKIAGRTHLFMVRWSKPVT